MLKVTYNLTTATNPFFNVCYNETLYILKVVLKRSLIAAASSDRN